MYVLELCGQRHSWLYSLWTSWKSGMLPSGTLLYCRWYCVQAHMCVCVCVHAHVCVSHSVVSNCLWPHGLQPTRLLCPWNSPGNNTGMSCQYVCIYVCICMYMCIYIWFLKTFYGNIIVKYNWQCCMVSAVQHSQSAICIYALPPPPPSHPSRSSQSMELNSFCQAHIFKMTLFFQTILKVQASLLLPSGNSWNSLWPQGLKI